MTKGSFAYKRFIRHIRFCSLCTFSLNMNMRFVKMAFYKNPLSRLRRQTISLSSPTSRAKGVNMHVVLFTKGVKCFVLRPSECKSMREKGSLIGAKSNVARMRVFIKTPSPNGQAVCGHSPFLRPLRVLRVQNKKPPNFRRFLLLITLSLFRLLLFYASFD